VVREDSCWVRLGGGLVRGARAGENELFVAVDAEASVVPVSL
jgi:hypothetical protein